MAPQPNNKQPSPLRGYRWKALAYVALATAVFVAIRYFHVQDLLKVALDWIGTLGVWGPLLFIILYVVGTVLFLPGSFLTLGAGALFGLALGSAYVSVGATLGATCAFLVSRYLARDTVARKIRGNEKLAAIDQAVAREGWKIVLLTRLSPAFPFFLLNYAYGLTRVKLSHYVLASWIGMMPGTVLYVYLGSLARVGVAQHQNTMGQWIFYGIGLLATVAVTVYITRIARQALAKKIGN